jgi:hypothetical protein
MGKKSSRTQYVSKGIVGTTKSRSKSDEDYKSRRAYNQMKAFISGKNVVLTIPNPNPNETNKRFIKVNARDVWKSSRR